MTEQAALGLPPFSGGEPLLQTPNPPLQSEERKGGKEHDAARLRTLVEGAFGWRASCFGTSAEGEDAAGAARLPWRTRSSGSCPRRVCAPGLILQTEGKASPALPSSPCPALGSARTLPSCKQIAYRGEAAPGATRAPHSLNPLAVRPGTSGDPPCGTSGTSQTLKNLKTPSPRPAPSKYSPQSGVQPACVTQPRALIPI